MISKYTAQQHKQLNTKKIEKIQERALRFIYQDYNSSYDTLLDKSKALSPGPVPDL